MLEKAVVQPALLSREEAASYLAIGLAFLAELTASGDVRSLKIGRRRLYRRNDLDDWVAGRVASQEAAR